MKNSTLVVLIKHFTGNISQKKKEKERKKKEKERKKKTLLVGFGYHYHVIAAVLVTS